MQRLLATHKAMNNAVFRSLFSYLLPFERTKRISRYSEDTRVAGDEGKTEFPFANARTPGHTWPTCAAHTRFSGGVTRPFTCKSLSRRTFYVFVTVHRTVLPYSDANPLQLIWYTRVCMKVRMYVCHKSIIDTVIVRGGEARRDPRSSRRKGKSLYTIFFSSRGEININYAPYKYLTSPTWPIYVNLKSKRSASVLIFAAVR